MSYAADADIKRENANIDADTAMGTMLKYGSEGAKYFVRQLHSAPGCGRRPHQWRHPHPRQGFLYADGNLLPDRPARSCSTTAFPPATATCGSPTGIQQLFGPGAASPSRPTRTRCTAARASPTLIIPWRRGWPRPSAKSISKRARASILQVRYGLHYQQGQGLVGPSQGAGGAGCDHGGPAGLRQPLGPMAHRRGRSAARP